MINQDYCIRKEDFLFELKEYFTVKVDYERTKIYRFWLDRGFYLLLPNCLEIAIAEDYIEVRQYTNPPIRSTFNFIPDPTITIIKEENNIRIIFEKENKFKIELYNTKNINKDFLQLLIDRDI